MYIHLNVFHVCLHIMSHLSCSFQCPSGVRSTAGQGGRMFAPVWLESPSETRTQTHRHVEVYHKHVFNLSVPGGQFHMFHPYIMRFSSTLSEAAAASCLPCVAAGKTSHTSPGAKKRTRPFPLIISAFGNYAAGVSGSPSRARFPCCYWLIQYEAQRRRGWKTREDMTHQRKRDNEGFSPDLPISFAIS